MPKPREHRLNKGQRFLEKSFPFAVGEGVSQERWDAIFKNDEDGDSEGSRVDGIGTDEVGGDGPAAQQRQ